AQATKLLLSPSASIEASPQLELNLSFPINNPKQMDYNGSITLSDGKITGMPHVPDLKNIELDTDFQNDQATINALNINLLDTNLHINGSVTNFKKPSVDVLAEAEELNLAKLNELFPALNQTGLHLEGNSFLKIKFQGLASNPLAGNILAVAT